jgi:hypothetical protein
MTGDPGPGPLLVGLGVALILIGLLFWSGGLSWFGRLPGDIRIERGNFSFYFPIVTCIVVSVILTLIFSLFRR